MGYAFGVGREAPAFSLMGSDGSHVALKDFRGDWLPVVVFLRADHPDAGARLSALSAAADEFWGLRGQVLALADAGVAELRGLADAVPQLAFPLLADEGALVARAYGAYSSTRGTVDAVAYIVDRSGKIVWVGEGDEACSPRKLTVALQAAVR